MNRKPTYEIRITCHGETLVRTPTTQITAASTEAEQTTRLRDFVRALRLADPAEYYDTLVATLLCDGRMRFSLNIPSL